MVLMYAVRLTLLVRKDGFTQGKRVFNDRDAGFISKFITDSLEGEGVATLLNSLNKRIPISDVRYWILKKNNITSDYFCLKYRYQTSATGVFFLERSTAQYWNIEQSDIHCLTCLNNLQKVIDSEGACYEIHEHTGILQAIKVDLPDPLTGSSVIYSFQFSITEQQLKPMDKQVLKCLLPVFFHAVRQLGRSTDNQCLLSKREIAVLEWIKQGKSTWDISQVLNITERTVNFHVKNIFKKLGVVSRAQAVAVAIDLGVINSSVLREKVEFVE